MVQSKDEKDSRGGYDMRASGMLLPVTALPSLYGIGCFSKEAYSFVDFLKKSGQKYWQVLPFGSTGYGDSPYQSFSTFAGNPYFVDLETLIEEKLLTKEECEQEDFAEDTSSIDYFKIYVARFRILRLAHKRFVEREAYLEFCEENAYWLDDYALFMAIKNHFHDNGLNDWEEDIRLRKKEAMEYYQELLKEDVAFYKFVQYKFFEQWKKLKEYANKAGIQIIGDIPIYVAYDSADTWACKDLFKLDEQLIPYVVAGCPPDSFSEKGQLWGNPIYDWEYHKKTEYRWWFQRIKFCSLLYDVVRIDHFRGFDEYYEIPYGAADAVVGEWKKGPGIEFFKKLTSTYPAIKIIAEDLGFLTTSSRKMVKDSGFPGMKIIQFAFDSREKSDYLPHTYSNNCVVYTGTHDNDTIMGWFTSLCKEDKAYAMDYMNIVDEESEDVSTTIIKFTLASVADLAIIPVQDYLGLGTWSRMNTPSTVGNNWTWRLDSLKKLEDLAEDINHITKLYGR